MTFWAYWRLVFSRAWHDATTFTRVDSVGRAAWTFLAPVIPSLAMWAQTHDNNNGWRAAWTVATYVGGTVVAFALTAILIPPKIDRELRERLQELEHPSPLAVQMDLNPYDWVEGKNVWHVYSLIVENVSNKDVTGCQLKVLIGGPTNWIATDRYHANAASGVFELHPREPKPLPVIAIDYADIQHAVVVHDVGEHPWYDAKAHILLSKPVTYLFAWIFSKDNAPAKIVIRCWFNKEVGWQFECADPTEIPAWLS